MISDTGRTQPGPEVLKKSAPHLVVERTILTLALIAMTALLPGCGFFSRDTEAAEEPLLLRTPHPTFTPTTAEGAAPASAQLQNVAAAGAAGSAVQVAPPQDATAQQAAPQQVAAPLAQPSAARAVVNSPLVNIRTGPSVDYDILATVERGAEYEITGRDPSGEWWAICCIDGQGAWISAELVDTDGPVDSVAVTDLAQGGTGAGAVGGPASLAVPEAQEATANRFDLESQEQFPETGLVRIYAYVYGDSGALAGYGLRVTKNGTALPVTSQSFGGQPAFTWPFQDARQRYQNLKIELAGEPPAGEWTVELIDSQSQPVGPPATFTLVENDPNQELYVRYKRQ